MKFFIMKQCSKCKYSIYIYNYLIKYLIFNIEIFNH
jgi:hypothetical protein